MLKQGMKLTPKTMFRINCGIPEGMDVTLEDYRGGVAKLTWAEDGIYHGTVDLFNDFYFINCINAEMEHISKQFEIKEAILTTIDGKEIHLKYK